MFSSFHSSTPVITSGARDAVRMQSPGIVCGWASGINNPSSWDSQDSSHEHPAKESFLLLSLMPPFSLALLIYYTESGEVTAKVSSWFEANVGFELMTKCQRQDCCYWPPRTYPPTTQAFKTLPLRSPVAALQALFPPAAPFL